jgi:hypothetical protein
LPPELGREEPALAVAVHAKVDRHPRHGAKDGHAEASVEVPPPPGAARYPPDRVDQRDAGPGCRVRVLLVRFYGVDGLQERLDAGRRQRRGEGRLAPVDPRRGRRR